MIFVDTSFWVALRNRRDAHHDVAKELLAKFDLNKDGMLDETELAALLKDMQAHRPPPPPLAGGPAGPHGPPPPLDAPPEQ